RLGQVHGSCRGNKFTTAFRVGFIPSQRLTPAAAKERVPRHFTQTATQNQHGHVNVRPPFGLDLHADVTAVAFQLNHLSLQDTFTLHRHQGRGLAERHAHLELGCLARSPNFLRRNHVDTVIVLTTEPQVTGATDPDGAGSNGLAAFAITCNGTQLDLTALLQFHITLHQSLIVAATFADRAQVFALLLIVVAVEATHHTLADRETLHIGRLNTHRHVFQWLAV